MAFCSNCGTKLNDGDVFCYACGAPQTPAQGVPGQAPMYGAYGPGPGYAPGADTFAKYMKEILYTLKGMIIAPASTAAAVVKKCFLGSSLILGGALMVVQMLLAMWAAAQAIRFVPLGSVLLYYLLLFVIYEGLLYLVLQMFGCYVFRGKGNWVPTLNIVVSCAVPFTASMLIGIVFGYIFGTLGQVVFLSGALISLFSQFNAVKEGMELSGDKALFTVVIANFVALFLSLVIIGAIVGGALRGGLTPFGF